MNTLKEFSKGAATLLQRWKQQEISNSGQKIKLN